MRDLEFSGTAQLTLESNLGVLLQQLSENQSRIAVLVTRIEQSSFNFPESLLVDQGKELAAELLLEVQEQIPELRKLYLVTKQSRISYDQATKKLNSLANELKRDFDNFAQELGVSWQTTAEQTGASLVLISSVTLLAQLLGISIVQGLWETGNELQFKIAGFFADVIEKHQWNLLVPGLSLFLLNEEFFKASSDFSFDDLAEENYENTLESLENLLSVLGDSYTEIVGILAWSLSKFGFKDKAVLTEKSAVSEIETLKRKLEYRLELRELLSEEGTVIDRIPRAEDYQDLAPDSLENILYLLGEIDAIGDKDQAVIRIVQLEEDPPKLILLLPSTVEWTPGGPAPNDGLANLYALRGHSAMVELANQALAKHLKTELPSYDSTEVEILLAGFSQGGITAMAFANTFHNKYRVSQLVTVGSPVANYGELSKKVPILSFEDNRDPVTKLDASANPENKNWITKKLKNSGTGFIGAHNVKKYAKEVEDLGLENLELSDDFEVRLQRFFSSKSRSFDYYGKRVGVDNAESGSGENDGP